MGQISYIQVPSKSIESWIEIGVSGMKIGDEGRDFLTNNGERSSKLFDYFPPSRREGVDVSGK